MINNNNQVEMVGLDPIRSPAFAAKYLNTTVEVLAQYRHHNTKPDLPYFKDGHKIGYRQSVLDAYIENHTIQIATIA